MGLALCSHFLMLAVARPSGTWSSLPCSIMPSMFLFVVVMLAPNRHLEVQMSIFIDFRFILGVLGTHFDMGE